MTKVTSRLEKDDKEQAEKFLNESDFSMSELVRASVRNYAESIQYRKIMNEVMRSQDILFEEALNRVESEVGEPEPMMADYAVEAIYSAQNMNWNDAYRELDKIQEEGHENLAQALRSVVGDYKRSVL